MKLRVRKPPTTSHHMVHIQIHLFDLAFAILFSERFHHSLRRRRWQRQYDKSDRAVERKGSFLCQTADTHGIVLAADVFMYRPQTEKNRKDLFAFISRFSHIIALFGARAHNKLNNRSRKCSFQIDAFTQHIRCCLRVCLAFRRNGANFTTSSTCA